MQSRATRVTVLRTSALMILKLVNPLESLEDRIAIQMNRMSGMDNQLEVALDKSVCKMTKCK